MDFLDLLSQYTEHVSPDATLREAAQRMRSLNVAQLQVVQDDELVGVITEHDITARAVADGCDPNRTTVRDVMTWQLLYLDEGPRAWYTPA